MKIKKTLCCLFAILFVVGALGVNAMAVSVPYPIMIIDNDPVSSTGYSYSQSGFVYFTDGSLYNGDARKAGLSTSNYYNYTHPDKNLGKSFHVSVSAYLK